MYPYPMQMPDRTAFGTARHLFPRTCPTACDGVFDLDHNFQMSLLYSSIVLSEEKKPALAMFTNIFRFHFALSS